MITFMMNILKERNTETIPKTTTTTKATTSAAGAVATTSYYFCANVLNVWNCVFAESEIPNNEMISRNFVE